MIKNFAMVISNILITIQINVSVNMLQNRAKNAKILDRLRHFSLSNLFVIKAFLLEDLHWICDYMSWIINNNGQGDSTGKNPLLSIIS